MDNFNDPLDRDFIRNQQGVSDEEGIIPVDFEVVEKTTSNYLSGLKDPDSMCESIKNIQDTYKTFGEQYGIEIKFDVDKVSDTFRSIISDRAEKVFNLYLSKSYGKMRLSIFNKILISVQTLVDRITTKDILESDNLEMSMALLERLFELMDKVNTVYKDIKIESADLMLKTASKEIIDEDNGDGSRDLESSEVEEALRLLRKTTLK